MVVRRRLEPTALRVPRAQTGETAEWEPMPLTLVSSTARQEVQEQEELAELVLAELVEVKVVTQHVLTITVNELAVRTA
jgi:hypothetical protein